MSRIHTRCNAHREQLENAMSAGASRFEMSFTPAVKLGAVVASIDRRHHDVLQISTDTFIDLEHALTVGHTKPSDNHLLNNFGIGLYVFQAGLGEKTQAIIYTVKKRGGEVAAQVARTGSLQDEFWSALSSDGRSSSGSGARFIARTIADVKVELKDGAASDVRFDWGRPANRNARGAMLETYSPWRDESNNLREDGMLAPVKMLLRRLGDEDGQWTLFVYHTADFQGSCPALPYELGERPSSSSASPSRGLFVRDKHTNELLDVVGGLQHSYIAAAPLRDDDEEEVEARIETASDTAAPSPPGTPPADGGGDTLPAWARAAPLPEVLVQGANVDWGGHQWAALLQEPDAAPGDFEPVYLPSDAGFPEPVAFARVCPLPRSSIAGAGVDPEKYRHNQLHLPLHKAGLDGAYFVLHGTKVINDRPGAAFDGQVFGQNSKAFSNLIAGCQSKGNWQTKIEYGNFAEHLRAGDDTIQLPEAMSFSKWAKWSKIHELWPNLGLGHLTLFLLNPRCFALDGSKTRLSLPAEGMPPTVSLAHLVSALRVHVVCWCIANTAPPEPPAPKLSAASKARAIAQLAPHNVDTAAASASQEATPGEPAALATQRARRVVQPSARFAPDTYPHAVEAFPTPTPPKAKRRKLGAAETFKKGALKVEEARAAGNTAAELAAWRTLGEQLKKAFGSRG